MKEQQFQQYKKVLDECKILSDLCGTICLDEISSSLSHDQYDEVIKHPMKDILMI